MTQDPSVCLNCLKKQAERLAALSEKDPAKRDRLYREAVGIVEMAGVSCVSSPEVAEILAEKMTEFTGIDDPFSEVKSRSNSEMTGLAAGMREALSASPHPLEDAARFAVYANSIDYGMEDVNEFDPGSFIERALELEFAIDDSELFFRSLDTADSLLYVLDNAGETVADRIFIEELQKAYPKLAVIAAVRGKPVLNDVTRSDLAKAGFDKTVTVVDSGRRLPGIPVKGSREFELAYLYSDVILAKGQGNFESERDDRRVFFLFLIKCRPISEYLKKPVGGAVFYEKL